MNRTCVTVSHPESALIWNGHPEVTADDAVRAPQVDFYFGASKHNYNGTSIELMSRPILHDSVRRVVFYRSLPTLPRALL